MRVRLALKNVLVWSRILCGDYATKFAPLARCRGSRFNPMTLQCWRAERVYIIDWEESCWVHSWTAWGSIDKNNYSILHEQMSCKLKALGALWMSRVTIVADSVIPLILCVLIQIGTHESNLSLFLICSLCMFLFAILCPPPKIHTFCVVNAIPALYATGNSSLEYLALLLSILISKSLPKKVFIT